MKRLEITVEDQDLDYVKRMLESIRQVKDVKMKSVRRVFGRISSATSQKRVAVVMVPHPSYTKAIKFKDMVETTRAAKVTTLPDIVRHGGGEEPTLIIAESSLAKDWLSDEDDRYDALYARSKARREAAQRKADQDSRTAR